MNIRFPNNKLDAEDELNQRQKDSFKNGKIRAFTLKSGYEFWRFVGSKPYADYKTGKIVYPTRQLSTFWMSAKTMKRIMSKLQYICYDKKALREYIRNDFALLWDWNNIKYRQKIIVKKEFIAHVGIAGIQQNWGELIV